MQQTQSQRSFVVFYIVGFVLIAVAGGAVWKFWKGRETLEAAQAKEKAEQLAAGPSLAVVKAALGPSIRRLTLVGEAQPLQTTTLYSKVSGYLSRITVDVGDVVKAGQLISEIQAPEIEAQIATIAAGLENKRALARRARELTRQGFFSQQALDNAENDVRVAQAQIGELRTQGAYRVVKAPFAGVITNRFVDPGALVQNASTNQLTAQPIVTISDVSRLKVTVFAEQGDAPNVKPGLDAEIIDAAAPERKVAGKITRVSGELDARTRTRRVEIEFANADGSFLPGSFVNVAIMIPATSYIEVPSGALVTRDKKPFVAVVDADSHIRYTPITVAGTDGKVVRVAAGLNEGTPVAVGPPASLADGGKITVQAPPPKPPEPAKPAEAPKPAPEVVKPVDASKPAATATKP